MNSRTYWASLLSALAMFATPTLAQQPTQAQISAIRGACRGDYQSVCASVPTGGQAALQCLQQHASAVSSGCREALAAIGGTPAPAAAAAPAAPEAAATPLAPQPQPPEYLAAQETAKSAWPHTITKDGASLTIYQPQAVEWAGRQKLTARAAIAVTPRGQQKPILGTIELTLATTTDEATGIVHLSDPTLIATHFPSLDTQQSADLEAKLRADLPLMETHEVPLTAVLLSLKQIPVASVTVNNDPPVIFTADRPASLVVFDGDPVLTPIGKTGLSIAVNTNWAILFDQTQLVFAQQWRSGSRRSRQSARMHRLPNCRAAFNSLPKDANFAEVRKSIPAPRQRQAISRTDLRQHQAGGNHRHQRVHPVRSRCGDRPAARGQHAERIVFRTLEARSSCSPPAAGSPHTV